MFWKMALTLDEFAIEHLLYTVYDDNGDRVYWRERAGESDGYMLVWPDGEHLHTYRHPENIFSTEPPQA